MVKVSGSSIVGIVLTLLVITILIFNVVYINAVRTELGRTGTTIPLNRTAATIIFWVDIILIVLAILYLIYNFWVIFSTPSEREVAAQALLRSQAGLGVPLRQTVVNPPRVQAETLVRPYQGEAAMM